MKKFLVINFIW